jgi:UDP-3-O-[3-hydroxymyristoyl] N-acetylglucosamine deacetylase
MTRRTVSEMVTFEGLGLHSGAPVRVDVNPGENGIAFRHGIERVLAIPSNVTDTTRCTKLGSISTIEHMMSALAALEITDAEIELDAAELPAMDGSAKPFFDGLCAAGLTNIGEVDSRAPFARLFLPEEDGKIAVGSGIGHWRYVYDSGDQWPRRQSYESFLADYGAEIAPARTLVRKEEIERARAAGLGRGLTEESVVIVDEYGYENEARFPDEIARHKLLDLIGDLYLSGVPIRMLNVVAERSGHRMNVRMAQMLLEATVA